uniref:ABC-type xenobiotic transporter n=1 Tax=Trypanosoma congolense (strain IL3000) TaxID=1068625 RepID=F9WEX2_TRYCI|nr:unnamed protein product [Trypanosoma congolense IL3000]
MDFNTDSQVPEEGQYIRTDEGDRGVHSGAYFATCRCCAALVGRCCSVVADSGVSSTTVPAREPLCQALCALRLLFSLGFSVTLRSNTMPHRRLTTARLMERLGLMLWLLLMFLRSFRQTYPGEVAIKLLLPALVLCEWSVVVAQLLLPLFNESVVMVDLFLAALQAVVLAMYVGLDWLMINSIYSVFPAVCALNSVNDYEDGNTGYQAGGASNFGPDDLLELSDKLSINAAVRDMQKCGCRRSIFRVVTHKWGCTFVMLALVRLLYEVGALLPAHLLRVLVESLSSHHDGHRKNELQLAVVMVVFIVLCNCVCTFLRTHYRVKLQEVALYNRGLLTAELFRCTLCRRKHFFNGKTQGDIINHLSLDVVRVAEVLNSFNDLWALPLQLALALYLIYIQVSFAFVAGVVVSLLLIPINMWLSKWIQHATTNLMRENDHRVLRITEIVNNIVYVKMCGWTHLVQRWVNESRDRYLGHLKWLKYLDAFCVFFWATTPTLVSLMTFMTFVWMGGDLTPGKAVSALALFNSLTMPLNAYPFVINGMIESYVSWCRLNSFLVLESNLYPVDLYDIEWNESSSCTGISLRSREEVCDFPDTMGLTCTSTVNEFQPLLQVHDGAAMTGGQRLTGSVGFPHPVRRTHGLLINLRDIVVHTGGKDGAGRSYSKFKLHVSAFKGASGQLIAIVGTSGTGKSTFLDGLAGECFVSSMHTSSCCAISRSSMAYVEQQPFLMSGTLRENILTGLPYDSVRYEEVISATALADDIRTHFAAESDSVLVGDRGIRLSGGQKARVALARALYAGKELYLVDDVLGCLDATVSHHIATHALLGAARSGSCVIVATHNAEVMQYADAVYKCEGGKLFLVKESKKTGSSLFVGQKVSQRTDRSVGKGDEEKPTVGVDSSAAPVPMATPRGGTDEPPEALEAAKHGALALGTLTCYLSRVGWSLVVLIIASAATMQLSRNAGDQYLVVWTKRGNGDVYQFIRTLAMLAGVNSILALVRGFSFAFGGLRAATRLHNELLGQVVAATFTFFSSTPPGRIINRLCSDMYTIDDSLPFIANILLAQSFLLCGSVLVITVNSSLLLIMILIPLGMLYNRIQNPYRSLSRELRRLEEAANAPLLDTMRSAVEGGVMIRSLGGRAIALQLRRAYRNADLLLRAKYNTILIGAWFNVRLELIGLIPLVFVGATAIYYRGGAHVASIGLALAYVQPLTSYVGGVLGAFASTETELICVERVRQYLALASEGADMCGLPASPSSLHWPTQGEVDFANVSMRYDPGSPIVLRSLSFHIGAGEKVAIVGRTGAGKSSIFAALLRLAEIEHGSIKIDGCDIRHFSLEVLRTRLSVLPQQPFIFSGSLRKNIDPFEIHTDDDIRAAAACVKLDNIDLEYVVGDGSFVSAGQRHQIGLARVILQRSPLLLLDEPTSQISAEAESVLWNSLDVYLKDRTILCITHKYPTLISLSDCRCGQWVCCKERHGGRVTCSACLAVLCKQQRQCPSS